MIFLQQWDVLFLIMAGTDLCRRLYRCGSRCSIFNKIRAGNELIMKENLKFKSAMLHHFANGIGKKAGCSNIILGALRNNNARMLNQLGADTGWDSIGDFQQAEALSKFLRRLDTTESTWQKQFYTI